MMMDDTSADDRSLAAALRAVAADEDTLGASSHVEARLLAEVQVMARARQRRANVLGLAAAAVLFLGLAVPGWYSTQFLPTAPPAPADRQAAAAAQDATREETTAFFPLQYSNVPAPGAHLIRLQVPRTALASFGIASFNAPDDTSPTVLADVVVGDDGLARAVRFVRVVSYYEPQERQP
jgi:hypothetical protein